MQFDLVIEVHFEVLLFFSVVIMGISTLLNGERKKLDPFVQDEKR